MFMQQKGVYTFILQCIAMPLWWQINYTDLIEDMSWNDKISNVNLSDDHKWSA